MTPYLKSLSLCTLLILGQQLMAQRPQDELGAVTARPFSVEKASLKKKSAVSLALPFFDDFSYNRHRPTDSLWANDRVYINQTMGTSPPTLGMATFDGLDRFGLPYNIDKLSQDTTDVLTSRPINLSNPIDSVYLSFFWQAGGLGESPEAGDSLQLQFYHPADSLWHHAWSMGGTDSSAFVPEMVAVPDTFFLDNFRFRFRTFGSPAGSFDIWNLDYVYLADRRNFDDTTFFKTDIAFTRPHPSLLESYEAVPWFHYSNFVANTENKQALTLYYKRNFGPTGTLNPDLGLYRIFLGSDTLAKGPGSQFNDPVKPNFIESSYMHPIGNFVPPTIPAQEFEITAINTYFGAGLALLSSNDTVTRHQVFSNYYAYDDGTAERAYQVADNGGGIIVSRYEMLTTGDPQTDSIKGLYIYFLPSEYDPTENEFSIVIFADNNGQPGNLLYESDSVYTPQLSQTNFYLPYVMDSAILGNGTVFMGIRQKKSTRLPIGFDRNNVRPAQSLFYGNVGSTSLFESFRRGTIMMRPYLKYQPLDIGLEEAPTNNSVEVAVYPNPASDRLYFDFDPLEQLTYRLMDLGGKTLQSGKVQSSIGLKPDLSSGVYLLQILDISGKRTPRIEKILIAH